jgi:TolB-like protein
MSHVFVSYARSTAKQAQLVASTLRGLGHQVWLDDEIPAHRAYADVIEERLREAKAVVVIWSAEAAKSEWVRSEADRARAERKLVQLTVDRAALPMPFDQIQCADLAGWQGDPAAAGWKKVVDSVALLLGGPTETREAGQVRVARPEIETPERFSVALSAFSDPTGAAAGDDFADGLVAETATALARFPILQVGDAGPESAARYRLEGSVRRSGPRVRVNVQLRDAAGGERVWAEGFDGTVDDPFAFQDDIASTVAGRVEAAILSHETRRIAGRRVESLSAHELWLRARETIRRGGLEQVDEIGALAERAVALEPGHAHSLALLACALGFRIAYAGDSPDRAVLGAKLQQTVDRAMLSGADDPEVLIWVAEALLMAERDIVVARALAERALEMNPGHVLAWDISANILMQGGEYEEALARYERFLHLDPKSPWRTWVLPSMGCCLVAMGRFDEAIAPAKEGLQIAPNNPWGAAGLIAALAHSGRVEEAREILAQFDPRQAGVFRTSQFGPKLTGLIDEALKLASWTGWAESS